MSTTFWHLCSDVILEICRYFSLTELYFSFYPDVLPYLFELLMKSHIKLQLHLTSDQTLTAILLSLIDFNQIVSLHISSNHIPLNLFHRVRSITLTDVSYINQVFSQPSSFLSLQRLILIFSRDHDGQIGETLRCAFRRLTLKYLQLNCNNGYLSLSSHLLHRSRSIKQLVINASCSQATLDILLDSLPKLHYLRLKTLMTSTTVTERNPVPIPASPTRHHSSLEIIDLVWYHPTMKNIALLLRKLHRLKRCRLSGSMDSRQLDGKSWHRLIVHQCSHLMRMTVNMLVWLNSSRREEELLVLTGDFRRVVE